MAADLFQDIQQLSDDPSTKNGIKHKLVNEITNKFKNNCYSKDQLHEFMNPATITKRAAFVKRLYVNFLIEEKNEKLLTQSLLFEDDDIINDIIKRCDFFWSNQANSLDTLMMDIFPKVSYSQRNRILKVIERKITDPELAKKYYDGLAKNYNVPTARPFLKHCSLDIWLDFAKNVNIFLTEDELFAVFSKRSKEILDYFKELVQYKVGSGLKNFNSNSYTRLFEKLLHIYPEEAFQLFNKTEQNFSSFTASRKLTKMFIRKFNDFVISDATSQRYNRYNILKYLTKEQLESYLCSAFPDHSRLGHISIPNVNYYVGSIFKLLKTNEQRLDLLKRCYKRVFGLELFDDRQNITFELMGWIDDTELRHKLAVDKFENYEYDKYLKAEDWIPYMKVEVSIPKLKELIHTSMQVPDRSKYLRELIRTCEINKDFKALLEVLKYFNFKHKNEQLSVRNEFINQVGYLFPKNRSNFNQELWEEIYNIVCNFDIKSELTNYSCTISAKIFVEALTYSTNDKNLFEKWFTLYEKWCTGNKCFYTIRQFHNKATLELISLYINKDAHYDLLQAYIEYNRHNKDNPIKITEYKWAMELFHEKINLCKMNTVNDLTTVIKFLERDPIIKEHFSQLIFDYKCKVLRKSIDLNYLDYLIEYMPCDPEYVKSNIPQLCDLYISSLKEYNKTFDQKIKTSIRLKKIPTLEIELHKRCYEILKNEKTDQLKEYAIWILWPYLSSNEFFEISKPYYPKEKVAQMGNDECQFKFMFQKRIAYCLKNYRSDPEILVALKAFCSGDFLQLTVGSLNSICQKMPYYRSKEFLENSINVPVSFKKHILRLLHTMLEKSLLIMLLKKSWTEEKNPTIRKILLERMLKYLVNEFDNEIWWNAIEQCLKELNHKDKDIIEICTHLNEIPTSYLSEYIELMWKKILEVEKELPQLQEKRFNMLIDVNNRIQHMKDEFLEHLLKEYLFNIDMEKSTWSKFTAIAVSYMLSKKNISESDIEKRLKLIIDILKSAHAKNWDTYNAKEESYNLRGLLTDFISHFFYKIFKINIEHKEFVKYVITTFVQFLKEIIDPETYFYTYYMIFEYTLIYFEVDKNFFEFGKIVRNIIDREVKKYDSIAIAQLASDLAYFMRMICTNYNIDGTYLLDGILFAPLQSPECALVAHFLTNVCGIIEDNKLKRKYNEILLQTNDKRIKLHLNNKFN
ncbi:uncharacterized protein LOC129607010 [Condylostylus longicornis]|uniref:uncharacterized protein LOC129607010 n=1 Tax=Condylostylus longicornis TaxID=2530218 RepID=UPI00244E33E0|nr:uncharacterized protein LOC129607010 [Condylostylus longicornis]XP_055373791.1 uncharacterized protein LOC129607010 [Condylostylus longicornis]XP_055373873.1 uncharacterized protein LOC129607010 [Condylostylus longicornis]